MKIAYLISAYKDPEHLKKLIKALYVPEHTWFFIHIDQKIDIEPFYKELGTLPHVNILSNRVLTTWGGYSQCKYQIELFKACSNSNINFDRVCVLTGQDYPIGSNDELFDILKNNPDVEYISTANISKCNIKSQKDKIEYYYFYRDLAGSSKVLEVLTKFRRKLFKLLKFKRRAGLKIDGKDTDIFFGSGYFCITYKCMQYILEELKNRNYEKFFKSTYIPEELMIQTIFSNSPFEKNKHNYNSEIITLKNLTPIHHIDYTNEIKKFNENDYDELIESAKWFFRKAETGTSDRLIEMIDKKRNHKR